MQVDWFTVIAQVINFLVLVWLLKKFLYKPVLDAIDERENTVATELKNAAATMQQANKVKDEFEQKNALLQKQSESEIARAKADAETYRQKLLEDARVEAGRLRAALHGAMQNEQETISRQLRQKTQDEVFAIASKTLADLASATLEEQVIQTFITRLGAATNEEKTQLITAFNQNGGTGKAESAFEIPARLKNGIEQALSTITGNKIQLMYNTNALLVSGIEISTNGYKLGWNIDSYLAALQEKVILAI